MLKITCVGGEYGERERERSKVTPLKWMVGLSVMIFYLCKYKDIFQCFFKFIVEINKNLQSNKMFSKCLLSNVNCSCKYLFSTSSAGSPPQLSSCPFNLLTIWKYHFNLGIGLFRTLIFDRVVSISAT